MPVNSEIAALRGRLEVAKQNRIKLRLEAKGLISSIRDKLQQYEPNPATLQLDVAKACMDRLAEIGATLKALDSQIDEMEDALG